MLLLFKEIFHLCSENVAARARRMIFNDNMTPCMKNVSTRSLRNLNIKKFGIHLKNAVLKPVISL